MNYLAHCFLSGNQTDLLIGNFIADAVRGKQMLQFSEGIQQGILLHREIDYFTDVHPVVAATKSRLRPQYGKYAAVIGDMFYDHFLAANFPLFSSVPLGTFTAQTYSVLQASWDILPERVQHFLPHMIKHNWLLGYAKLNGIHQALSGLSRRTTFNSGMETAVLELEKNYRLYADEFLLFMPELIAFSAQWIAENGNQKTLSGV